MLAYTFRRLLLMIPTLFAISVISFVIIQLPPGDFLDSMLAQMEAEGGGMDEQQIAAIRARYGLDQPIWIQYFNWIGGILTRGDFGQSFEWNRPVSELLWERLGLTVAVSFSALIATWLIAFPIGIYSAVRKYSIGDYIFTGIGMIGLATPSFLVALILMYVAFAYFGQSVGGLFSPEYRDAPWSWGKFVDLLAHIWIPLLVIATNGTASLIRILRANLLDELNKPYVVTARAKGLTEARLLIKYPVRAALNPFVSSLGYVLVGLISGEAIISVVLNLPTTGPILLQALKAQDMYLAASFILMLSVLTVIGTLLSDILLAALDPRIRYQ
ncbi:MAG: ABC transporter permease [Paracoccaceae bacterium]